MMNAKTHIYIGWSRDEIPHLGETKIALLLTEVCGEGFVTREIGLDARGAIVHRAPTSSDPHGLFGSGSISPDARRRDLTAAEFERLWGTDRDS